MSNYIVWHQHGEVQPPIADESDGKDYEDQMHDMIANIGRGYDLGTTDPPPEEQNFYGILACHTPFQECLIHTYSNNMINICHIQ
jgi:hypothetical protein